MVSARQPGSGPPRPGGVGDLAGDANRKAKALHGLEAAAPARATAQPRAEAHEALARLAAAGVAPAELLDLAADLLRKHFPHDEVLVLAHPGLRAPPGPNGNGRPNADPLRAFGESVLKAERACCLTDTGRSHGRQAAALATAGVGSAAGAPCCGPDGPVAALVLARRATGLRDRELTALAGLAAHLATAVHAAGQRAALQRSYQSLKDAQSQHVRTERLAAVGQMAAGVAHDFNNMLASIMMRAELLRQALTDPESLTHLEVIERAAHDGARTVRRLQDFTRQGTTQDFRPLELNVAVRESLEMTKSRWKDDAHLAGIAIEVRTELGEVPPVPGDGSEIREILTNLIVNAVDAMPQGGILRLATRWLPLGNRVELTVSDTGTGMTEEVRAQVFDPFFSTKGPGGSGLGLSVSYGIVKRHRGSITVETAPGAGTTFIVQLPAAVEAGTAADASGEERDSGEVGERPAAPPGPLRILVIDDEEPFRASLYSALHREGHFVAVAASGEEGLRLFRISTFDVVFTDLGMPGMGGWQVAQTVKRVRPGTPVVLITGWGATLSEADRGRPEVDAVLAKPVTSRAILQLLARLPLRPTARRGAGPRGRRASRGGRP